MASSDLDLLAAWVDGDDRAGGELFERHGMAVHRFFANKASADAEDLVQQTFLASVESRERFREVRSFRAFLFGIARNVLLRYLRKKRRGRGKIDPGVTSLIESGVGPIRVVVRGEQHRALTEALARLPIDWQICVELYYWEHLDLSEIAEALGIAVGTVKSRLARSRARLEDALREMSGGDEELLQNTLGALEKWAGTRRPRPSDTQR
jgi:RNA polymerase sigma-70 factor (ECF subfamily)